MEIYKLAHTGKELDTALDIFIDGFKTEELNVTENGSYTLNEGVHGFSKVNVNIQPPLEEITITGPGEYTPSEGMYGISKVLAEVDPKGSVMELVYETEFSIEETVTAAVTNFLTIETGFESKVAGESYVLVIRCVNDMEEDATINHFIACIHYMGLTDGGYAGTVAYGANVCSSYRHFGARPSLYVSNRYSFMTGFELGYVVNSQLGIIVKGDYSLKLYRIKLDYFGL